MKTGMCGDAITTRTLEAGESIVEAATEVRIGPETYTLTVVFDDSPPTTATSTFLAE